MTTVASRVSHHDEDILDVIIITSINQSISHTLDGDLHDATIHL